MRARHRVTKGTIVFRTFMTIAVLTTLALAAMANIRSQDRQDAVAEVPVIESTEEPQEDPAEAAAKQATLVAQEDTRVAQIAGITSPARYAFSEQKTAYDFGTFDDTTTLVLTPDKPRYSWADVKALLGDDAVPQGSGAYLLKQSIAVSPGTSLTINSDDVDELRLASGPAGFVSIVSIGGTLNLVGTAARPLTITSWDSTEGEPDVTVSDGRAYVRALGGEFNLNYVQSAHLGFWSGRTGGIAFTGTDNTDGSVDALVTGSVLDSTLQASAYGLFVNAAKDVQIARSVAKDNLLDGFLLHRSVTGVSVSNCIASNNGADGIVVDRGVNGVALTAVTSQNNGHNGISLDGQPLADGPSASGAATVATGDHSVTDSTVRGNGGDGIEVIGGTSASLLRNTIEGNDRGITLRGAANTSIVDNRLRGQERFGIFARDGVTNTSITGNDIAGGTTSVYLRDAVDNTVRNNSVTGADGHAISLVDEVGDTTVTGNDLAGKGTSAIDTRRAHGELTVQNNDTSDWRPPSVAYAVLHWMLHPLRAIWATIILSLILSALLARRKRYRRNHPYANQWRTAPARVQVQPPRPPPDSAAAPARAREFVAASAGGRAAQNGHAEPSRRAEPNGRAQHNGHAQVSGDGHFLAGPMPHQRRPSDGLGEWT